MSRLARFQKKPITREYKLEDENGKEVIEKIIFHPYKTPDMGLLLDFQKGLQDTNISSVDFSNKIVKPMIRRVIKHNYPDITDEEFEEDYKNMAYSYVDDMLIAIMEANGSGEQGSKAKIIEDIKHRQK